MAYTHNFEISVNGVTVSGEISFDSGNNAAFKTTNGEEMEVSQHRKIQDLFEMLVVINRECGEIQKIEIVEKP